MPGIQADYDAILKLNEVDSVIETAQKSLQDSQYMDKIKQVRAKKNLLKQKRDQIDKVFVKTRNELQEITDKDQKIAADMKNTQAEINKNSGDYRKVKDNSAKLDSLTKQREQIDKKLAEIEANFNQIKELKAQIEDTIGKVSMTEDDLTSKMQEVAAKDNLQLKQALQQRTQLQEHVSSEALEAYKTAFDKHGALCVSKLTDGTCSSCRTALSNMQLAKAKSEAPATRCPGCGRLLLVS